MAGCKRYSTEGMIRGRSECDYRPPTIPSRIGYLRTELGEGTVKRSHLAATCDDGFMRGTNLANWCSDYSHYAHRVHVETVAPSILGLLDRGL